MPRGPRSVAGVAADGAPRGSSATEMFRTDRARSSGTGGGEDKGWSVNCGGGGAGGEMEHLSAGRFQISTRVARVLAGSFGSTGIDRVGSHREGDVGIVRRGGRGRRRDDAALRRRRSSPLRPANWGSHRARPQASRHRKTRRRPRNLARDRPPFLLSRVQPRVACRGQRRGRRTRRSPAPARDGLRAGRDRPVPSRCPVRRELVSVQSRVQSLRHRGGGDRGQARGSPTRKIRKPPFLVSTASNAVTIDEEVGRRSREPKFFEGRCRPPEEAAQGEGSARKATA